MTPKDVMIQTLRAWMLGDYGHDLPADHFEQEVDRLILGLEEFGFAITPHGTAKEAADASISRELHLDQILTLARELGAVTEKLIASEQAYRKLARKSDKEIRAAKSLAHSRPVSGGEA